MKLALDHICDRLWINHPFTANIEFTLREFKLCELQSRVLLIVFITTKCIGLALCNVRFLYAYFQATVCSHTELEVLRIQNLHA